MSLGSRVRAEAERVRREREETTKTANLYKEIATAKSELQQIMDEIESLVVSGKSGTFLNQELRMLLNRALMKRKLLSTHQQALMASESTATMRATAQSMSDSINMMREATREANRAAASAKPQEILKLQHDLIRAMESLKTTSEYAEKASASMFSEGEKVNDEKELENILEEIRDRAALRQTEAMSTAPSTRLGGSVDHASNIASTVSSTADRLAWLPAVSSSSSSSSSSSPSS